MDNLSKEKLQYIIKQSITLAPQTTYESLKVYKKIFGSDRFTDECALTLSQKGPLVSLICLNCSDSDIDEFLSRQLYSNLEIVRTSSDDSFADIIHYISSTESKYLCFCEPEHEYDSSKIFDTVYSLEQLPQIDILITSRNFVDEEGAKIAASELLYSESQKDIIIDGTLLLQYSINQKHNLFGNLSTLTVTTQHAKTISYDLPDIRINKLNSLFFLFHLLIGGRIHIMNTPLVSTMLQPYKDDTRLQETYEKFADAFCSKNALAASPGPDRTSDSSSLPSLPKEITFFYSDMGEYYNLEPIAQTAARRGYKVEFTQNLTQKAEIGVYCQHVCFPENSRFSVILLHDLMQGHNRWPDIWDYERWDKFDIGIVPGKFWASLWSKCACRYYANPRFGTYELGYPKSDLADSAKLKHRAHELRQKLGLKYDFSILYAPSWEYDNKEDDFIRSLSSLKANLLIKQAHWLEQYEDIINNIRQMRSMHENKYENVYYIEPKESIMTALELCDMVVSDESSVMIEALMFHKPSIAVTDWLIPDTVPSRPAIVPVDFMIKCHKSELREYAEKLISSPDYYHAVLEKGTSFFSNQGQVCEDIMDAIEYYTGKKTDCSFLSKKLASKYATCSMWI